MAIEFVQLKDKSFSCLKGGVNLGTIYLNETSEEYHFKPVPCVDLNYDDINYIKYKLIGLGVEYTYRVKE